MLEWVACINQDKLVLCYLKDVKVVIRPSSSRWSLGTAFVCVYVCVLVSDVAAQLVRWQVCKAVSLGNGVSERLFWQALPHGDVLQLHLFPHSGSLLSL